MSYKKFIIIFSIISFFTLLFITVFNYFIDPAAMFNNKKVEMAIEFIKENKSIAQMSNYDERKFKKELIFNSDKLPQTIVLGSSRAMGIKAEYMVNKNSFGNYSISGASFDPDIALLYIFVQKFKAFPQKVIIEVPPWSLNHNRDSESRNSLQFDYYNGLKMIGLKKEKSIINTENIKFEIERFKALISISMLRASLKSLKNEDSLPIAVDKKYNLTDVILPDGSIKYSKKFDNTSKEEVLKRVQDELNGKHLFQLKNFFKIDEIDKNKFIKLIHFLKENNVQIVLYFSPYHPMVYNYMLNTEKYKNVFVAEKIFLDVAEKENLKIIGSYDPYKCGITEEDFADDKHLKTSGYEKLFKNKF